MTEIIRSYHVVEKGLPYIIFIQGKKTQKIRDTNHFVNNDLLFFKINNGNYEYIDRAFINIDYQYIHNILKEKNLPKEIIDKIYSFIPIYSEINKSNKYISYVL